MLWFGSPASSSSPHGLTYVKSQEMSRDLQKSGSNVLQMDAAQSAS